jgi:hypothetical protein
MKQDELSKLKAKEAEKLAKRQSYNKSLHAALPRREALKMWNKLYRSVNRGRRDRGRW